MEIANLVISILSLFATIAISFVIYFLEQHNQKVYKEKEVKKEGTLLYWCPSRQTSRQRCLCICILSFDNL